MQDEGPVSEVNILGHLCTRMISLIMSTELAVVMLRNRHAHEKEEDVSA